MYPKYAKLKAKIAELTAKAKQMEIEIIKDLSEKEGNKLMTEYATFSLIGKKKYQYSVDYYQKEALTREKLKFMKHEEEVTGKAILLEDGYMLRCQLTKEEK